MPNLRLLPFAIADGPANMAADEAMLLSAETGVASLRLYGWSPATLSLGYFQQASARNADDKLASLPWVRRPSGGATLVHDRELTYALALPSGSPWQDGESWMPRMHRIIADALVRFGVETDAKQGDAQLFGPVLCFQQQTLGDLVCRGGKIVGSAQRKHRRCLLQHGSILVEQSPHAPALAGIRELTGVAVPIKALNAAIVERFRDATGWEIAKEAWTSVEEAAIATLERDKYRHPGWNEKR